MQYAHFAVLKAIKYCSRDDKCVAIIVKGLKKQMTKLAIHNVGSRVVELIFSSFPHKSTVPLRAELYGKQFTLFADSESSAPDPSAAKTTAADALGAFLSGNPDRKEATLEHISNLLHKGIDKSLFGFAYFQRLLYDYVQNASPNQVRDLSPALAEHSIHLLSTRQGVRVVAECAAYATPKDRKKMLKCLKGYTRSSLLHRDAYLAILRLLDVCDDTVTSNKLILAELTQNPNDEKGDDDNDDDSKTKSPIIELILSDTASKLFLNLLSETDERRKKYLDPYELDVLRANPTVIENGETVPTSKKSSGARRRELMAYLRPLLTDACRDHAGEMMRTKSGGRVLREVCEAFPSGELFGAVVNACELAEEDEEEDETSMFEDAVGHLVLKQLLLSEAEPKEEADDDDDDDEESFARALFAKFGGSLFRIASSNRGAFVVAALAKVPCVKEEAVKELLSSKAKIQKLAEGGGKGGKKLAGCAVLLDVLK